MKRSSPDNFSEPRLAALRANWLPPLLLVLVALASRLVGNEHLVNSYHARILNLVGLNITLAVSLQLINGICGQFSLGHAGFMAVGAYLSAYPSTVFSDNLLRPSAVAAYYVALAVAVLAAAAVGALLGAGLYLSRRLHAAVPVVLLTALVVWMGWDLAAGAAADESAPSYLVWSHALRGATGLYDATLSNGLSVATILDGHLPPLVRPTLTMLILLLGGGVCAAAAGLVVGIPALRLRGDYLAIATLGFAQIISVLVSNSAPLGGAMGLNEIPQCVGFGWTYGVAVIAVAAVWRLVHSARGRAMLAVREDEIAAAACGINPAHSKVLAFVVGAFFAGAAGALLAHREGFITPDRFSFLSSVEIVVMVTLGGQGSIVGAIIAAAVLSCLPEWLRGFADYRMIVYSLLLIVMMLLRPQGVLGGISLFRPKAAARHGGGGGGTA